MKLTLIAATLSVLISTVSDSAASDGISVSAGPMISNLEPSDASYEEKFLTPGTTIGLAVDIDAPGILDFRVSGEYFWKDSGPAEWDGELSAFLISIMPLASYHLMKDFSVFAGAGGVYITGKYSGSDEFGEYVEADGSAAGFTFAIGAEVVLVGPISGRLEYRRCFADLKTDNAVIDGLESTVYPAAETDLGNSQFCITFPVSIFGGEESIF